MKFNFKKNLSEQKGVRLHMEDALLVEQIAKNEGIQQAEVIREFVREAARAYVAQSTLSDDNQN